MSIKLAGVFLALVVLSASALHAAQRDGLTDDEDTGRQGLHVKPDVGGQVPHVKPVKPPSDATPLSAPGLLPSKSKRPQPGARQRGSAPPSQK